MTFWIIGLCALLFLSAVASGSEIGLYSINRVKLRFRVEAGDRRYRRLFSLVQSNRANGRVDFNRQ